jgi:hypothetical protein
VFRETAARLLASLVPNSRNRTTANDAFQPTSSVRRLGVAAFCASLLSRCRR